jgi:hypothetical protein
MKKNTIYLSVLILFIFAVGLTAYAAGGDEIPVITLKNPFRLGDDLMTFIKTLIDKIILPLGGMLAVLAFIYSGFLYVTAQGNDTKIEKAHRALLYTAIGTGILLGSWAIAMAIGTTIGQLQ